MAHDLSLVSGTQVTRVTPDGKTEQVAIQEVGDGFSYYDFYGEMWHAQVRKAEPEKLYYTMAASGEGLLLGESHTVFCRPVERSGYERMPIHDLKTSFVRLPQKKSRPPAGLFDAFEADRTGISLGMDSAAKMFGLMHKAAFCGVTVRRHKTERRLLLDDKRPTCFATKLINGNFQVDLAETLDNLAQGGIIQPYRMFGREFVAETERKEVIFEGNCIFNDVMLMPTRRIEKTAPVYHIELVNPNAPVELAWFHS